MSAISRRIDRAEAVVAPKPRGRVIVFEAGDDLPRDQIEAFERELGAGEVDLVIMIRDFIDRLSAPRHVTTYLLIATLTWLDHPLRKPRRIGRVESPLG
jgi:hypothetical protein